MLKNKKKFKSSEPYLKDIVLYARKIKSHISTVERKIDFKVDTLAYDAVSMMFLQIGESVVKLENSPDQIVSKFPDSVPWHELKGLRNLIAHDYARVDPEMMWDFTKKDIVNIEESILQILKQRFGIDRV